eukprot:1353996-Amphidinium_carterae.1
MFVDPSDNLFAGVISPAVLYSCVGLSELSLFILRDENYCEISLACEVVALSHLRARLQWQVKALGSAEHFLFSKSP